MAAEEMRTMWVIFLGSGMVFGAAALALIWIGSRVILSIRRQQKKFEIEDETERANIKQRQAEGIAAAKARGVKFGKPKKEMPDNFGELATMWFNGQITGSEEARKCGVALSTFRNRAERLI